jgi:cytochrome P450
MGEKKPLNDWNPRDPEVLSDQRRAYDEMREGCPVAHSEAMHWSVFRHADVISVLNDPETFINSSRHHAIPNAMNGPEHAWHRKILAGHFSPTMMKAIEPRCREIADEMIRGLPRDGSVDAIAELAEPIALRTMCAFLGWPDDTWYRVRDWIHGNRLAAFQRDRDAGRRLAEEYATIVTEPLAHHREQGIQDDVTGRLIQTEVDGHRWNDEDIIDTLRNWIAGHGTVVAAIGIVIAHLAEDQNLQRRLRKQRNLIPAAIDEIPRVDGPLVANTRTTTREVTIGGREISEGKRVFLMWIAANHDPEVFEAPEKICLGRDQNPNLLYGAGIHYCLGAPLARLELRVAVQTLLEHTSGITLAADAPLRRETYPGNGFINVPLRIV